MKPEFLISRRLMTIASAGAVSAAIGRATVAPAHAKAAPERGALLGQNWGAVRDGSTNNAQALIDALGTGDVVVVPSGCHFFFTTTQAARVLPLLNNILFTATTTFDFAAGEVLVPSSIDLYNPSVVHLTIKGATAKTVGAKSVALAAGSSRNYHVTYRLSDASGVAVGDYLLVHSTAGKGDYRVAEGCFKVIAKSGNDVTVKHTLDGVWPAASVSGGECTPLKTTLRWPANTAGIRCASALGGLSTLALAGGFDISSAGGPADSPNDGLQVGTAPNTSATGLNESEQINFGSVWAQLVGFVEWEGNGVQVNGGSFYGTSVAACSNGWRGFQAGRGGSCEAKYSAAIGNGASGYEAEAMGWMNASGAVAAGNQQQGFYSIGGGTILALSAWSILNRSGIDVRKGSIASADGVIIRGNSTYGVHCIAGMIVAGANAAISNNALYDIYVGEAGAVDLKGAAYFGTSDVKFSEAATFLRTDGSRTHAAETGLTHAKSGASIRQTVSSAGDLIFSFDVAGRGSFANAYLLKGDGSLLPAANGRGRVGSPTHVFGALHIDRIKSNETGVSFQDVTTPIQKPTVTGSRSGNAALRSLIAALAEYGLIADATTP